MYPTIPRVSQGRFGSVVLGEGEDVPGCVLGGLCFPPAWTACLQPTFLHVSSRWDRCSGRGKKGKIGKYRSLVEGHSGALCCVDCVR